MTTLDIQTGRSFQPYEMVHQALHNLGYTQRDNFFLEKEIITENGYYSYAFLHEEFAFMSRPIEIAITPESVIMFYHEDEDAWYSLVASPEVFFKYVYSERPIPRKRNDR